MKRKLLLVSLLVVVTLLATGWHRGQRRDPATRIATRIATALPALHAEPDPAGGRIVDAWGREVLLRGVNVNAFVEYWAHDPELFTTYPLTEEGIDLIASIGWNTVRLLISWSRVEPMPGVYDEAYLDEVEAAVHALARRGIYSIIDLHQDAWGPTLAGDPADCPGGEAAFGWDGAPGWATLGGDFPRCLTGNRELTAAVVFSFDAFWNDAPGPGGIGIRTRYVAMLGHVAERFAPIDAVAGYDVMNEPNQIFGAPQSLADLYAEAIVAIRAGEAAAGAPRRLVFFEPSITWADFGVGVPPPFPADDQIVYSPHIYQGGLNDSPLTEAIFQRVRDEAGQFGGAPVLSGEWGGDPDRASDPDDDYFERHQALQDRYRFGATLWTFREACGDPHKAGDFRAGRVAQVWGLYEVDCTTNQTTGLRDDLVRAMTRPYLRAAPGRIVAMESDPATGALTARGEHAARWRPLVVFLPDTGRRPRLRSQGLRWTRFVRAPGGHRYLVAWTRGGGWSVDVRPRR